MSKHQRHTYVRNAASKQCKRPVECFSLYGDEMIMDGVWTMESSQFFLKTKRLDFGRECE